MKSTIALGYLSRFLSLGSGVLILPLILKGLTKEEFVFWMIFVTFSSLVNVIDFGFMSTFSRYFNYAFAGASVLPTNNADIDLLVSEKISYDLLGAILLKAKKVYFFLASFFCVFCFLFYFIYLKRVEDINGVSFLLEWAIYAIGLIVSVYYLYFNALLSGLNKIEISYLATISSTVIFFILALISNILDYGLLGICISKTISIIIYRVHCYLYLKNDFDYKAMSSSEQNSNYDLSMIYKGAFKLGVSTLGAFLTNRASVFIIGFYLTLEQTSKFALGSYLFATIVSVSLIAINTTSPSIARCIINQDSRVHKNLVKNTFLYANLTYLGGSFFIIFFAEYILTFLKSNTHLPNQQILFIFAMVFFLELNQQLSTTYLTLNNNLSYVYPVLISGIGYVILTTGALNLSKSLIAALLCQFTSQMIYNNWYWPMQGFRIYKNIDKY